MTENIPLAAYEYSKWQKRNRMDNGALSGNDK